MNRLAGETSPYLRQHADNPVDWRPWGDEAFAEARARDVPVFLSVGYSACHWCHVMAHESFEDAGTATMMNDRFVNVKVDREERPDVDAIYMEATQAMTGRGGWPMSVWLAPDGRPFHCGTYFPPDDRQGMPSFGRVCDAISEAWRTRRGEVLEAADRLTDVIGSGLPESRGELGPAVLDEARARLVADADTQWGGFGRAPKFPQPAALSFLARMQGLRGHDDAALAALTVTLDAMAAGGMYDQVGGGFSRYSVDDYWLVPHFEKMLYDNAQLVRAYTHGWQLADDGRSSRYARIVEETIAFVQRELQHPDGGCYSALDADSEGVEGKFYLWSIDEIRAVCGADADAVIRFYGVTDGGNFVDPHTSFRGNVLHRVDRAEEPDATIQRARAALLERRAGRVRPGLDDKVLLAWNALMVRGLAEAAWVFDRTDWLDEARRIARFCLTRLRRDDGRLLRSWQADADPRPGWGDDGRARHLAYGEDYGALLEALVTLAEVDSLAWLDEARAVADGLVTLFADPAGGFFTTGVDAERLLVRPKDQMDNATPSENSLAANGLLRLAALTGDDRARQHGESAVARLAAFLPRHPLAFAYALEAAERVIGPAREIAVIGAADDPRTKALQRIVARRLLAATVVATAPPGADGSPVVAGRGLVGGAPAAYVCEHYTCAAPVSDPAALAALLR